MADLPGILPPDAGRLERAARRYAIAVLAGCPDAADALESLCGACRVVTDTMEQVRDFDPCGEVVYTTHPRLLRARVALYLRWCERVERMRDTDDDAARWLAVCNDEDRDHCEWGLLAAYRAVGWRWARPLWTLAPAHDPAISPATRRGRRRKA